MISNLSENFFRTLDKKIAIDGAILHDLGKAHPYFQKRITGYEPNSLLEREHYNNYKHRHEISSLAFLPVFPKHKWDVLIEMVVAHHKSIKNDASGRGIMDLYLSSEEDQWIKNHVEDWEMWSLDCKYILEYFGYEWTEISVEEASEALNYAHTYCKRLSRGWSRWRGLLKAADHYASAFNADYDQRLNMLFRVPDLSFYTDTKRQNSLYPLSELSTDDIRPHTLVVAPTGAGKTDFLLKRTRGRIFYILPFQASINAMYDRFRETITPSENIRIKHGTSKIKIRKNVVEQTEQDLVGASVKILTPHQLASVIFATKNFESIMLDIEGCDVILDEIHTYADVSQSMVIEIVKVLLYLKCRVHIGTATMPQPLYDHLYRLLGESKNVYEVSLAQDLLSTFNRHQIYKHTSNYYDESIQFIIQNAVRSQEKLLIIFNTVKEAQRAYQHLAEQYVEVKKMLIHSRFRRGDRVRLEQQLIEEFNTTPEACIVVSTQVVEVSLDISFDRMITQAAPLDSMVQRFGRINRKRNAKTIGVLKPIHVLEPSSSTLPYTKEIVQKSYDYLQGEGSVFEENQLQRLMDKVYQDIEIKPIDGYLKFIDSEFYIKKLTDNPKSILIEALEIDGVCCVLECDREPYLEANWQDRVQLEIPMNYNTLKYYPEKYEQLEVGSHPFVIPQDWEDYKTMGLQLVEHNIML